MKQTRHTHSLNIFLIFRLFGSSHELTSLEGIFQVNFCPPSPPYISYSLNIFLIETIFQAKQSEADSFAQIPLGKNYTLSMPISADFQTDGLELDDDQINKLALIQQGLTNMLRGRIASSESE